MAGAVIIQGSKPVRIPILLILLWPIGARMLEPALVCGLSSDIASEQRGEMGLTTEPAGALLPKLADHHDVRCVAQYLPSRRKRHVSHPRGKRYHNFLLVT
jgi:hypothetical protein